MYKQARSILCLVDVNATVLCILLCVRNNEHHLYYGLSDNEVTAIINDLCTR